VHSNCSINIFSWKNLKFLHLLGHFSLVES
jgi:hypothetical protein